MLLFLCDSDNTIGIERNVRYNDRVIECAPPISCCIGGLVTHHAVRENRPFSIAESLMTRIAYACSTTSYDVWRGMNETHMCSPVCVRPHIAQNPKGN